mgnify:FL=1
MREKTEKLFKIIDAMTILLAVYFFPAYLLLAPAGDRLFMFLYDGGPLSIMCTSGFGCVYSLIMTVVYAIRLITNLIVKGKKINKSLIMVLVSIITFSNSFIAFAYLSVW